jgi:large subunit ribosomal protein L23
MNHYDIIKRPVVTEKSTMAMASNFYVFYVDAKAKKPAIAKAVATIFEVDVTRVNTLKEKPKNKQKQGRISGRTNMFKKAYVQLAAGQTIDFTNFYDKGDA